MRGVAAPARARDRAARVARAVRDREARVDQAQGGAPAPLVARAGARPVAARAPRAGAHSRSGGLGDDQGTRVGSPDSGARGSGSRGGSRGPSTQPVSEGLEGSIHEGASGSGGTQGKGRSTGAGAEATEGIHGASSRRGEASRTSATNARSAARETSSGSTRSTTDRSASEPLKGSEHQHVSGYGGAGGKPKSSSDQRESTGKRDEPIGGSRKRGSRAQGQLGDEEAGDGM